MLEVLRIYTHSPLRNFSYLVHQLATGETLCIDPFDSKQIEAVLESKSWNLEYIVNTHEHFDHISGNQGLVQKFQPEVLAHPNAISIIPEAKRSLAEKERILSDKDGKSYLEVLYTPGHTFAHICLLQWEDGLPYALFSGDTVFNSGVGNCTRGGNPEALYHTIADIFQDMPGEVILYPGHDYLKTNLRFSLNIDPNNQKTQAALQKAESLKENEEFWTTRFSEERTFNPFFLLFQPGSSLFAGIRRLSRNEELLNEPKSLFITLRSLRDKW